MFKLGLDVGSTTLKAALINEAGKPVFLRYVRHLSKISETAAAVLGELNEKFPEVGEALVSVSGSAGMGVANTLGLPFVQEVYAEKRAVEKSCPNADAVVELGGEDAKILFLTGGFEMRMNGTCAGGTGAFIDQMAALMRVTPDELGELAEKHEKVYAIVRGAEFSPNRTFSRSLIRARGKRTSRREFCAPSRIRRWRGSRRVGELPATSSISADRLRSCRGFAPFSTLRSDLKESAPKTRCISWRWARPNAGWENPFPCAGS